MSHVFVSLIGTQVFGTLQSLMVVAKDSSPLQSCLLHTSRTRKEAERIKDFIASHNLGNAVLYEIDQFDLTAENGAPAKVAQIAREAVTAGKRIYFNVDGGMNFMLSACALSLRQFEPLLVLATRERAIIYDYANKICKQARLPDALTPEEILALQAIPYKVMNKNPDVCASYPLEKLIREHNIQLPPDPMHNVEISGIVFDYVWSCGNNRLNFFKDWRFAKVDKTLDKKAQEVARARHLGRERDFAQWSTDRKRCGQLYDKQVYALVWNDQAKQRLEEDSGGQIKIIDYNFSYRERGNTPSADDKLSQIFKVKVPKIKEQTLKEPAHADLPPMQDDTLVVCMGTNLMSTLVAICSHKPRHLVLCYNRKSDLVEKYARNIEKYGQELGLVSVTLANYPIEGLFPEQYLPQAAPGAANININISPGTKGQACMLSLWGAANNYALWSLNNSQRACSPLPPEENIKNKPMKICDPLLVFQIMGRKIFKPGKSGDDISQDFPWLDALMRFMRRLAKAGGNYDKLWKKSGLRLGKDELQYRGDNRWRLSVDGKNYDFEKEDDGPWYEKLCARALMNAGASKIRLNLTIGWNEENAKRLLEKYAEEKHILEMDVVGCYKGDLVLISCKCKELRDDEADLKNTLGYAANEARNMASDLGRFALSMVSDLGNSKSMLDSRVTILGWRDICDPESLREHIRVLRSRLITTVGEE